MHLVHKGMAKETIPASLPPNLIPPSKRKSLPGAVPVLPAVALGGGPGSGRNTPVMRSDSPALKVYQEKLFQITFSKFYNRKMIPRNKLKMSLKKGNQNIMFKSTKKQ